MSSSRTMNIASIRATSLRTSGLQAAFSRRAKEKKIALTDLQTETRMSVDQLSCLPSSVSVTSTKHLSYTDSHEPGEDSQLNAFAMVDKLVNLNASPIWEKPELSIAAEQSGMKGPQSGLQSLARNADMKNLQGKMGMYDWIDSQPDENGGLEQAFKGQQKQLEACMPTGSSTAQQEIVSNFVGANDTSNDQPCNLMRGVSTVVSNELRDTSANNDKGETEIMDIGANTQTALEAIDILRSGALFTNESAPYNEKVIPASLDIGNDTQTAVDAMDLMRHNTKTDMNLSKKKVISSLVDIGNDTQMAIDAIDIMRSGIEGDVLLPKVKAASSLFDIGNETQTAIDVMDMMKHGDETDDVLPKVQRRETKRGSKVQNSRGNVKKHARGDDKPVGKKVSSRGVLKTLKSQRTSLFNPAGPVYNSNQKFLLEFLSTMVPRRKRSRLCSSRVSSKVFGWQRCGFHLRKSLTKADKQAQLDNPTGFEPQKSAPQLEWGGNTSDVVVLTESINGETVWRTKKETSARSDCDTLLEQNRKRRRCESRCIFVLFSHSLSDSIIKQQKKILARLGGYAAISAEKATHFVADTFVRSRNMLEIMAAGKLVVTTMWLEGCSQAEYFVDENSYILRDVQKEKQWGFCMHSSLAASRRKPLFKGMKVLVSHTTTPGFEAIKAMIESAGGQVLQKLSTSSHCKADVIASVSFIVGSEQDYDFCVEYLKKGCRVYSTELILHGVVTQNLDLSRHRLFENYVR